MPEISKVEFILAEQQKDLIIHHLLVMLVVNPDTGQILQANSAAARFYGWSAEKLMTMTITQLDLLPERILREIITQVQDQQSTSFQSRHRLADGQIRDVVVYVVPTLWKQCAALYSIIVDITDQKRMEAALRASEEKFRQFAQHLPVPLVYGNRHDGRNEFVNTQFVQTFGYTLDDVPTISSWWKLAYPDEKYRNERINLWENAMASYKEYPLRLEPAEAKITCKNGEIRLLMVNGAILDDGYLATFIDVTERRHDERLLIASYERKRKNDFLNDLIRQATPSTEILSAGKRMLGKRAKGPFNCYLLVMNAYKGKTRKYWTDRPEIYQPLVDSIVDELDDEKTISWDGVEGLGILRLCDEAAHTRKMDQVKQAEEIVQTIMQHRPELDISIGVAETAKNLYEMGNHYRQAVVAVHSGRKIWPQRKIFHYQDIGLLQLLPFISDHKQLIRFIERTLGPVLQYDKKRKLKLLPTLEFIMLSDNLKSAAGMLSIHYKTLMFRKRQLERILGVSLDDMDARITLGTAIKMMKLSIDKDE